MEHAASQASPRDGLRVLAAARARGRGLLGAIGALAVWGAAVLLAGCEVPAAILVEIDSERSIPDEVDTLEVVAFDANGDPAEDEPLGGREFLLREGDTFPVVVRFEPDESTPRDIFLQVTLRLGSEPVEGTAVKFDWVPGRITWAEIGDLEPL